MSMIKPTPCRMVEYHPQGDDPLVKHQIGLDPLAAIVTGVHNDRCINVAVFGADGSGPYARKSVYLAQPDAPQPNNTSYATWMAYQVGQAAKTEALEQKLSQTVSGQAAGHQLTDSDKNPLDHDGDGKPGGSLPANERLPADVFAKATELGLDLRAGELELRAQIKAFEDGLKAEEPLS
jgi:hypothetical protein